MGRRINRSPIARYIRRPHLFLSHSSQDKPFVKRLAQDLNNCGVDAWIDEWELQIGDSLHDVLSLAMTQSKYIAVIISSSFLKSKWANDELKRALSLERQQEYPLVLPLVYEDAPMPAFIEERVYIDFQSDYYSALTRLVGMIHKISKIRIEDAISIVKPSSLATSLKALEYSGYKPHIILDAQDFEEIARAGGKVDGDLICFSPMKIAKSPLVSKRIVNLMYRISGTISKTPPF